MGEEKREQGADLGAQTVKIAVKACDVLLVHATDLHVSVYLGYDCSLYAVFGDRMVSVYP